MYKENLIVFDMNGVLTDSSELVVDIMARSVLEIDRPIAIISGAPITDMRYALSPILDMRDTYLLPEYGSSCFHGQMMLYDFSSPINKGLTERLSLFADMALDEIGMIPVDNLVTSTAHSQATISILGKAAPLEMKRTVDRTGAIRRKIIHSIHKLFERIDDDTEIEYILAGNSSIDVREDGWDKRLGVATFLEYLGMPPNHVTFYGDRIRPGFANWPVTSTGVAYVETSSVVDSFRIIQKLMQP